MLNQYLEGTFNILLINNIFKKRIINVQGCIVYLETKLFFIEYHIIKDEKTLKLVLTFYTETNKYLCYHESFFFLGKITCTISLKIKSVIHAGISSKM